MKCLVMRLEGIQTGDIVEVDRKGRRFYALVTGSAPGGLALAPTDRRVNHYSPATYPTATNTTTPRT
jgi:NMD protein affecting ribosome stability and mRNA decay